MCLPLVPWMDRKAGHLSTNSHTLLVRGERLSLGAQSPGRLLCSWAAQASAALEKGLRQSSRAMRGLSGRCCQRASCPPQARAKSGVWTEVSAVSAAACALQCSDHEVAAPSLLLLRLQGGGWLVTISKKKRLRMGGLVEQASLPCHSWSWGRNRYSPSPFSVSPFCVTCILIRRSG